MAVELSRRGAATVAVFFALAAVVAGFLTIEVWAEDEGATGLDAASLAGLLIGGLLTFLFGVAAVVATFRALSLSTTEQPLGLPSGSVQAFIALLLILLFFVMSIFLYRDVSTSTQDRRLTNLTEQQLNDLEETQIVAVVPTQVQTGVEEDGTPILEPRFDVLIAGPANRSDVAEELARQLITTIGTLIVAIAAFYFGAKGIGGRDSTPTEPASDAGLPSTSSESPNET